MSYLLTIEAIGDDSERAIRAFDRYTGALASMAGVPYSKDQMPASYWVAEILDFCGRFGFQRAFLCGDRDYTRANRVGSRGVRVHYALEAGRVYEVKHRVSWRRSDRYFVHIVSSAEAQRWTKIEVESWLRQRRLAQ